MKNFNLNPGGFIGALLGAGGLAAVMFLFLADDGDVPRRLGKLIIFGVVIGAGVGNFLWERIFPVREEPFDDDE